MSHSTVLVIGEDPETMLIPYDENTDVEPYRDYENGERPQDHWAFKPLTQDYGMAEDVDWDHYVDAYNRGCREGDSDQLFLDVEKQRVYQMSTYNPLSRWDWYQLGGRWTGFFKLKPDTDGVTGTPGMMTPMSTDPSWADQARKRDIDFEGMKDAAGLKAAELHGRAMVALDKHPPLVAWDKIREMFPGDIDAARWYNRKQPGLVALFDAKLHFMDPVEDLYLDHPDPLLEHVTQARLGACQTFAILDQDGWHERGKMGWWGMVSDEKDSWPEAFQARMDAAADDDLFSVYDVHI